MKNKLVLMIISLFLILPFVSSVWASSELQTIEQVSNDPNIPDLNFDSTARNVNDGSKPDPGEEYTTHLAENFTWLHHYAIRVVVGRGYGSSVWSVYHCIGIPQYE